MRKSSSTETLDRREGAAEKTDVSVIQCEVHQYLGDPPNRNPHLRNASVERGQRWETGGRNELVNAYHGARDPNLDRHVSPLSH